MLNLRVELGQKKGAQSRTRKTS